MGEFSKRELEIVDYVVDLVNFEIFSIEQEETDKGKLDYSLCSDNYEKLEVTKKKVAKFKSKIDKCNPDIAVYLIEFTKPTPKEYDFYDWRDKITKNFVIGVYQELIDELALIDKDELDKYSFSSIVKSRGYKYKPLKDYIQGVCDVNHYSVYKSFLEIPLDENLDYNHIITKINNAFFRLEAFMKGTINDYFHFDFSRAFTELFYYTRKPDNFTYDNCKRVGQYWELTEQIRYDYDKSDFENHNAYKNKAFCKDCEILMSINWDRIEEFTSFATPDELESLTKKKTVADLMNPSIQNQKVVYVDKPFYEQELLNTTNATKTFAIDKVDITYLNGVFRENEDILPKSILNAFNSIGNIKSLYITEDESEIINTYEDDLDPFDNLPGTTVIEYYCIESNYLNLISKIEDKTFIFCDNLPLDLYMFEYAKAFQKAYNDFEKNLTQKQTTIAEPQEQKALKIFSYVLNAKFKNGYFGDNTEALDFFKDKKGRYISNEEFSEWGYQGGQYYKAWEIILNNPVVFDPFFLKHNQSFISINNEKENVPVNHSEINDFNKSTIIECLEDLVDEISTKDFNILVDALYKYFETNEFPILKAKINFKPINKKRVGWALKDVYKNIKTGNLDIEYFRFAQENINLFSKEIIETDNFNKNKFYKMFTTNPAK